ncbi:MAG TPA: hypothetical protein VM659_22805 [Dongiaceae bacterium]|nr:hypothetical protein [Dongiaceae bacterium]
MSSCCLIYDDGISVPREIGSVAGIRHFGDLLHRKASLVGLVKAAAKLAGIEAVEHLRSTADIRHLLANLTAAPLSTRYLYVPANLIVAGNLEATAHVLGKLRWLRQNVISTVSLDGAGWVGIAGVNGEMLNLILDQRLNGSLALFMSDHRREFEELGGGDGLLNLASKPALLEFLSSNFDVRHFNSIAVDTHTVRKSSTDKDKIRREYSYWKLLPEQMKYWFVQPFDFQETADTASYAMERLNIPDTAIQWIHGALSNEEFSRFLERAFYFLQQRPKRKVSPEEAQGVRHDLYREKLTARFDQLRRHPLADQLQRLLYAGNDQAADTFDDLISRYMSLLQRLEGRRRDADLVIGHGDFCFSNILYDQSSGLMRLIDPRGADHAEELWTDPYYDLAKLSHSVLGKYDFINAGLCDVTIGGELGAVLQFNMQVLLKEKQEAFRSQLSAHGFDVSLVRLYEASLFLSMAPLHMDLPNKALAFLLNGRTILQELEGGDELP